MGLFMDKSGIPLAFCINPGNQNEQLSLKPLEQQIMRDFELSNLDDDPAEIARINHDRWEIEESFRIMKSEFDARPVYLHRDNRIKAHFLTCFI